MVNSHNQYFHCKREASYLLCLQQPLTQSILAHKPYVIDTVIMPTYHLAGVPLQRLVTMTTKRAATWSSGTLAWSLNFPPGSTIFIPSASLEHSNTSIQKEERHYSFTQYTAGRTFWWVDYGFQRQMSTLHVCWRRSGRW